MKPKIQNIFIPGLTIHARVWGPDDGMPILAMHGWLDNAATFDLLAPLLPHCRIVSVDFPGHGFSDPLPACSIYHHADRVIQMFQVADALGWEKFSILGHSMGGITGAFMASIFPDRIEKIMAIDASPFLNVYTTNIIDSCRRYYQESKKNPRRHTVYLNHDEAALRRVTIDPHFQIRLESALILAKGGVKDVPSGYSWTFDLKLLLPNFMSIDEAAIAEAMQNITSPFCLIVAEAGILKSDEKYLEKLKAIATIEIHECPGGHHLHLDEPQGVAEVLNRFLNH
jgi:pimeloyl-ACP methyl ester carboxylesterase